MKLLIFRTLALASLLAGIGRPVVAEDLDAALAAQKKKAERRIYSDSALIENRNLEVPRTQTEEELALDKKLREMDAKADSKASSSAMMMPPRAVVTVPQPVENKNWLLPASTDDSATIALTNQMEDAWLTRELDRQKELKSQESAAKENSLVEKLLREKTQPQSRSPELDRLKQYQLPSPNLLGSKEKTIDSPGYMTPRSGTPDPLAAIRPAPKKGPEAPPLFSPEAARISAALDKDPLRSTRSSSLTPNLGAAAGKPSSGFSSGLDRPDVVPLTPIEMIKKSSPINRADPFAENHMQEFKSSIWD